MALKRYCILALLVILALMLPVAGPVAASQGAITLPSNWMMYGGYNRTYGYYIPSSYNGSESVPLVFSFHGLGSSGQGQEYLSSFAELAEAEGFIAVFPDSTNIPGYHPILINLPGATIQWNLGGPGSMQYNYDVDDLGFISTLVDTFKNTYNIDASRVYATGMSDGALFSHYVAMMLPGIFAGIAPVCGQMTLNVYPYDFDLDVGCPVTVVMIHGTADPVVPYDGIAGATASVNQTIAYWRDADNTTTGPVETVFDGYPDDPTVITRYVYGGGTNGTEVVLYKVDGGGHTWPGSYQYAPESYIGKTSYEVNATQEIWNILKEHSLPPLPPIRRSSKEVTQGDEFEVRIAFAAPADNFQNITLTDTAPAGWTVSVNTTWPDPDADAASTPASNKAEYTWDGPYDEGTAFTALYKVHVPNGATAGNYTFTGSLDYSIGAEPHEVAVAGNTRVQVVNTYTLTVNVNNASGGDVTMPGEGSFTYHGGKVVYLMALSHSGYNFDKWSGNVSTVPDVNALGTVITMNGNYTITANFAAIETTPPPTPPSGGGCFIATAAYGTPTAKQLDVLRAFRDEVLLKSTVGSQLVNFYYKVSPPIANFISQHNVVRTLVRELLVDPIVRVLEATRAIW